MKSIGTLPLITKLLVHTGRGLSQVLAFIFLWIQMSSSALAGDVGIEAAPVADQQDRSRIQVRVEHLLKNALLADAHSDLAMPWTPTYELDDDGMSQITPGKIREGKWGMLVLTAWGPPDFVEGVDSSVSRQYAEQTLESIQNLARSNPGEFMNVVCTDQIAVAYRSGHTAILASFQNAVALEGSVDSIDAFYNKGVRMFGLNHLGHNDFSDSSRPGPGEPVEIHGGLSELGIAAIGRMNELGALIDISQLSEEAKKQALALTSAPVIASHSNAGGVAPNVRNISDELLMLLKQNGGVIGISPFVDYLIDWDQQAIERVTELRSSFGLSNEFPQGIAYHGYYTLAPEDSQRFLKAYQEILPPISVADWGAHVDHVVNTIGIEHVAIGNDFNHGGRLPSYRNAGDSRVLITELVRRGYSDADIKKIMGGNLLRVLAAAEEQSLLPCGAEDS